MRHTERHDAYLLREMLEKDSSRWVYAFTRVADLTVVAAKECVSARVVAEVA